MLEQETSGWRKKRTFSCAVSNVLSALLRTTKHFRHFEMLSGFYICLCASCSGDSLSIVHTFLGAPEGLAAVLRSHDYFQTTQRHCRLHHRYMLTSAQDQRGVTLLAIG